jgi:hypothetical protein
MIQALFVSRHSVLHAFQQARLAGFVIPAPAESAPGCEQELFVPAFFDFPWRRIQDQPVIVTSSECSESFDACGGSGISQDVLTRSNWHHTFLETVNAVCSFAGIYVD